MDTTLLNFSNQFGEIMFEMSVQGNHVIENFHQVWCNDVWKAC